ncbi:MAG: N-6 DNA methylase [Syntrophaceae bacterium]|nr:N-6 DNA methylase [Syntrophaceae bacterium]
MIPSVITVPEGKICDYIDNTFRNDTPEEYVRQNIEKRLINELKYPKERIKVEHTIKVGDAKKRVDLAIFGKDDVHSQENIRIIIECKKEATDPRNAKEGIGQLQSYMSASANCEWGLWTNGKQRAVYRKIQIDGTWKFQEFNDIPDATGNVDDVERPKRGKLKSAVEDNLLFVFKTCHNHIYAVDGLKKEDAFFELLKIIFCKISDERNFPNSPEFYTTSAERANPDGQLVVKNRIGIIFEQVKRKFSQIFPSNAAIDLKPRSLAWVVSELQGYSLLNTDIDIKGRAYEEIVGANLRGDKGQFFTPRNIMHMAVSMLNPKPNERVLDQSCGTGGFLVIAMNHVIADLATALEREEGKPQDQWGDDTKRLLLVKIRDIVGSNYFGFDIAPDLVKATKMNMVMNNDGSGNIYQCDTLLPPHEWDINYPGFRDALKTAIADPAVTLTNHTTISFADVIVTNPPFGSKIPIKDPHILEQYEVGYVWEKPKEKGGYWKKTTRLQSSVPPEQLFVERCLQFLKPGGRMAIVLPDSILGNPALGYMRQWLLEQARVIASIDLHVDTFQPWTGVQTSIVILQKKTQEERQEELRTRQMRPYNIFMAMVERVGHDKRGNPIFKRDIDGNEILVPEQQKVVELGWTADGTTTAKTQSLQKVLDDQSIHVPKVFAEWKKREGISW